MTSLFSQIVYQLENISLICAFNDHLRNYGGCKKSGTVTLISQSASKHVYRMLLDK